MWWFRGCRAAAADAPADDGWRWMMASSVSYMLLVSADARTAASGLAKPV